MPAPATNPLTGRVTMVVAAAGYGKTAAVRAWLGDRPARWYRGPDLAEQRVEADRQVTVIDDFHLAPEPVHLAGRTQLILIGRRPVPPAALRWAVDPSAEVGPAQLKLSAKSVGQVLFRRYGVSAPDLARHAYRLTGGWPALVHLVGRALAADPALAAADSALAEPGTPIAEYVCAEVLDGLPAAARRLLVDAAHLGSVSAALAGAVGHRRPELVIGELARLGVLHPVAPGRTWYVPVPVVAAVVRAVAPRPAVPRRRRTLVAAADWHHRHDRPTDALRLRLAAGDHAGCAALLASHGARLIAGGAAADVVTAIRAMPSEHRDGGTDLLLAEALDVSGDSAGAVAAYAALAGDDERLPPALAWRYGVALYLWRDPRDALDVFRRGVLAAEDTADEALLLGWTAAAHWLAGDLAACREHAERAHRAAGAAGDDRAMAAALVALALFADLAGDPAGLQSNYARALAVAEPAGDVVQAIRIRANLAAALERETRYVDALDTLRPAVALAERAGHTSMLAMATCNEAALLHRLGRLDEAAAGYASSIEIYQRIDSRKVAYPLNGLGDVHRQRGRLSEARAAYEEAVRAATDDGNRQGLIPALSGLARAVTGDDPALATRLTAQAVEQASGPLLVPALLAAGHAALRSGARPDARQRALAAAEAARQHRDRAGLAEALELRAAAADDPGEISQACHEALAIWRAAAAGLDADRVLLAVGRLAGASSEDRLHARLAAGRLAAAGVLPPAPPPVDPAQPPVVQIRTFGQFGVVVDGVAAPAWQSRKARDLVRILVARRGRPVTRDELSDVLWGSAAADADRVGHRLAVALSTARGVLDRDRRAPADHFISGGPTNLWLNLDRVTVDVESFLTDTRHGLRLYAQGATDDARTVLGAVEQAYGGDVYADDPYDEWAQPLRAEAQAALLSILRALVRLGRDTDEILRHLLRILAIEPYDERSHRDLIDTLVEAGRHGEARRAYDRYVAAMEEIGVPPPEGAILLRASA